MTEATPKKTVLFRCIPHNCAISNTKLSRRVHVSTMATVTTVPGPIAGAGLPGFASEGLEAAQAGLLSCVGPTVYLTASGHLALLGVQPLDAVPSNFIFGCVDRDHLNFVSRRI